MADGVAVTDSAGLLNQAQTQMTESLQLQADMQAMAVENNAQQTALKMAFDAENDGIKLLNGVEEAVTATTGTIAQQLGS